MSSAANAEAVRRMRCGTCLWLSHKASVAEQCTKAVETPLIKVVACYLALSAVSFQQGLWLAIILGGAVYGISVVRISVSL